MVYDEEYFPFRRVRLIADMEIPFRDLDDVDAISTFIANIITTYHYLKKSYETLDKVFKDIKKSEMLNIHYPPIVKHVQSLPFKLNTPKKP
jgi:hypothetical protein